MPAKNPKHNPKLPRALDQAIQTVTGGNTGDPLKVVRQRNAARMREKRNVKLASTDINDLTDLQRNFINEYAFDFNKTKAYIRAGGESLSASGAAAGLASNPRVKKAIAELEAARAEKYKITPERIAQELAKIAFSNLADYTLVNEQGDIITDFSQVDRDDLAGVQEIIVETYKDGRGPDAQEVKRVRFKLGDKKGALELLGKSKFGLIFDKPVAGLDADGNPILPPALVVNFVTKKDKQ